MKKLIVLFRKTTTWTDSIIAVAISLLLSINAIAQAPAPTDPYIADITSFGATANDGTDDTQTIQNAIDWLVANHPGGTVLVPPGWNLFSFHQTG